MPGALPVRGPHARRARAALGRSCSDHYAHYAAAILFWHRGFDIYRHPTRELCNADSSSRAYVAALGLEPESACGLPERAGARPLVINWPDHPRPYPPGALLYAAPEALLYAHTGLSFRVINRLTIMKHLIMAHLLAGILSLLLLGRFRHEEEMAPPPFARGAIILVPLIYLAVVPWAIGGIYDAVAVLLVVLAIGRGHRGDPLAALLLFGGALFLHCRAVWSLPLAIACCRSLRRRSRTSVPASPPGRRSKNACASSPS
ncbi:MAG TPA: hypothetical protein VGQ83_12075 [Polyangia bacterium]|jgi:hypothetical protein